MELKDCFKEDFSTWLLRSNNPKIKPYTLTKLEKVIEESLNEIFDILLREPLADYFWYGYPEYGGRLTYSLPSLEPQPVPGDSLKVDGEKIKIFLRDYKIGELLR
jgi:hypothetical protein